jgi:2,6-dihydroxypyridine 3-monooxygenase
MEWKPARMVGLNAALWLRDAGCDVEVYERSRVPLAGQGAGIVLNPATVRYFTENDVLDLDDISVPARWLRYIDRDGGVADQQPVSYRFSSYNALYRGLLDCFDESRYHLGEAVDGFDQDGDAVIVRLESGRTEHCDLLVCADGICSYARQLLLPDVSPTYAGYGRRLDS